MSFVYNRKVVNPSPIKPIRMKSIITLNSLFSKDEIMIGPMVIAKDPQADIAPIPSPVTLAGKSSMTYTKKSIY